ncbi:hypothetical protein HOLleu_08880 [Holothuria leucospilota]|uniref:HTH luxR-type domain-containing protein n=1 Tax=Holothuria leucospilota TaxID=206669 RepID=A0A9Q1CI23_HOLLE|nr:hypothetical protein HOLleu_08880 [Holothuria leucospilota]
MAEYSPRLEREEGRLIEDVEMGFSNKEIAELLKISNSTVKRRRAELGVRKKGSNYSHECSEVNEADVY